MIDSFLIKPTQFEKTVSIGKILGNELNLKRTEVKARKSKFEPEQK